ncbi:MAG: type I phosphomannose isomerase catalytic subunit [Candidatus Hydrogenedentota bacterium]
MNKQNIPTLLPLDEGYFPRIWGGRRLEKLYGKPLPESETIGEAWLVSDHPQHESIVMDGPRKGETLRSLLEEDARYILGSHAQVTVHGRFPLLLKLLDAQDVLSVQVHPDDECAKRLGEPDVGKTEMWHVLHAEPGSELICGLDPGVTAEQLEGLVSDGPALERALRHVGVNPGDSAFLPAGTVHAIGAGLVLAEIQQNSDITYRLYDWGRVQADGTPRELHIAKAREAIRFGEEHPGLAQPLILPAEGGERQIHAACPYFAAERVDLTGAMPRATAGTSFHIVLALSGKLILSAEGASLTVPPGKAVLIPGGAGAYTIEGHGSFLDYYVPNLEADIIKPARHEGYTDEDLRVLNPRLV